MTKASARARAALEEGGAAWAANSRGTAASCWHSALVAAEQDGDLLSAAIAHLNFALLLASRGDEAGAAAEVATAWEKLAAVPEQSQVAHVLTLVARALAGAGEVEGGRRYVEAARIAATDRPSADLAPVLEEAAYEVEVAAGDVRAARVAAGRAVARRRATGEGKLLARALISQGESDLACGRPTLAALSLTEAVGLSADDPEAHRRGVELLVECARALIVTADWTAVGAVLAPALNCAPGDDPLALQVQQTIAAAAVAAGDVGRALDAARSALSLARSGEDPRSVARLLHDVAVLTDESGDPESALALAGEALDLAVGMDAIDRWPLLLGAAEVAARAGQVTLATSWLEEAADIAEGTDAEALVEAAAARMAFSTDSSPAADARAPLYVADRSARGTRPKARSLRAGEVGEGNRTPGQASVVEPGFTLARAILDIRYPGAPGSGSSDPRADGDGSDPAH